MELMHTYITKADVYQACTFKVYRNVLFADFVSYSCGLSEQGH